QLIHKFTRGHVHLQFSGLGDELASLREIVGPIAPEGSTLVKIMASAALRIPAPVLSATNPLTQEADALAGIMTAARLMTWYREHAKELRSVGEIGFADAP